MMMVRALMIVMKVHVRGNMSRSFTIPGYIFLVTPYSFFPSSCWLSFICLWVSATVYPCCKSVCANIFQYKSFLQMEQSIIHFRAFSKSRWSLLWSSPHSCWSPPSSASRSPWRRRSGWLALLLGPAPGFSSTGVTFTRETASLDAQVGLKYWVHFTGKNMNSFRDWVRSWCCL